MKILLIAPQPFFEKRGTPLAVYQLLKAFSELGYTVDLVSYHLGEAVSIAGVTHHRALRIPFINKVKKGMSATKLLLDLFVFLKAFNLLRCNRYDCIHAVEEGAMMGVVLKGVFRSRLVYDMDSSIPEQLAESGSRLWSSTLPVALADRLERWTIRRADYVFAVCQALRDRVERVAPEKPLALVEDIPNVEPYTSAMATSLTALRAELGVQNLPVALYTGTFESYQGIDLLFAAIPHVLSQFPAVRFVLVGGDPPQVAAALARVEQLKIAGSVTILGKRPLEEMPLFMELADILLSPRNRGTNTPMKIYTYLQAGRPIVATRLVTHTQVLTDAVALLVEPEPVAYAAGITRLLKDEGLRAGLGAAGAELVRERFSFTGFKAKVEGAYRLLGA